MSKENGVRLRQQLQFIIEIDRLKAVMRRSYLCDGSRHENSAEHSWHLALLAMVLQEYANDEVDLLRVLQMVLIHDIVEIDAGDTYFYDPAGNSDKVEREEQAAAHLFGLLPADQEATFQHLWREFEARETADARFANALDRLMPLLHNYHSKGKAWKEHAIVSKQVVEGLASIGDGADDLWQYAQQVIADAVAEGYLAA